MKFTEEQFKQLVKIQEKYFTDNVLENGLGGESPYGAVRKLDIELSDFIYQNNLENETVAIMNPATRKLAYEQFVEPEKNYVWRLKTDNNSVISKLFDGWFVDGAPAGKMRFSEKEIAKSPFKPEWFDKEEVE